MKNILFSLCTAFFLILSLSSFAQAQTKQTLAKQILKKLESSAQMEKENWEFSFSKDCCTFTKQKNYHEIDGSVASSFRVTVPIDQIEVEKEIKSYDSLFQCSGIKRCIRRNWLNATGVSSEQSTASSASLFIKDAAMAHVIFVKFSNLKNLCDRSNYQGPSGLKWGNSIKEARQIMDQRFDMHEMQTVNNGTLYQITYGKSFAGYKTRSIVIRFVDNKFFEMNVSFDYVNENSISKKWYTIVSKMIDKYGNPNHIDLPKSIQSLQEVVDQKLFKDFSVFDMEIKENSWRPKAIWEYKNNVAIIISVKPTIADWEIVWRFYHKELHKQSQVKVASKPYDDF